MRLALTALATLLIGLPQLASANVFITADTTINTTYSGVTFIGYADQMDYVHGINPTSPTVQLVGGGQTGGIRLSNSSVLNINGGLSTGTVFTLNNSTATLATGTIAGVDVEANSSFYMTGGVTGSIEDFSSGTVDVSGGTLGNLNIDVGSTLNLTGGTTINGTPTGPYVELGGHLNIYGNGLSIAGVGNGAGSNFIYTIAGKLDDGSALNGFTIEALSPANFSLINATPEPDFWVPLAAGLAGLFGYRRWRRRTA